MSRDCVMTLGRPNDAVNRIADFVSYTLQVDRVCETQHVTSGAFRNVLIVAGGAPFAGKELLDAVGEALIAAERVVWITNDYAVQIPIETGRGESPYRACRRERLSRGRPRDAMWSTCLPIAQKGGPGSTYINWNALTWDLGIDGRRAVNEHPDWSHRKHDDQVIYYGYYREGRRRYWDRYFLEPRVATTLSYPSSGKSSQIVFSRYRSTLINHAPKFSGDLYSELSQFGLGLYLEDERSHREYHSLANRFYEMLSAGLPIVIQPEAISTFLLTGRYEMTADFVVTTSEDVKRAHDRRERIYELQAPWRRHAREEHRMLPNQLALAWKNLLAS